jgi:protein-glutamine gamma-glutamyltransferase
MESKQSSDKIAWFFMLISLTVAAMLGIGQSAWNLPLLVLFCGILGSVFTDRLEWILFPRWMAYSCMILGALVAIARFFGDGTVDQIQAVGNLLVYVQLPLFFQRRSKQVFEQWGVFLLLELVVAALINNSFLFGVLMLPVLVLGCATFISLACYSSMLEHNEPYASAVPWWRKALELAGVQSRPTKVVSGIALSPSRRGRVCRNDEPVSHPWLG